MFEVEREQIRKRIEEMVTEHWVRTQKALLLSKLGGPIKKEFPNAVSVMEMKLRDFVRTCANLRLIAHPLISEKIGAIPLDAPIPENVIHLAAITCAVITTLDPMRVENPDPHNTVVRYVNPIFAMRCGMTIVQHPFHHRSFDELRRIYDKMLVTKFPCLAEFIKDVQSGTPRSPEHYNKADNKFTIGLSQKEMSELENYVSMFSVFQQMKIYKTPGPAA